MAKNWFVRDACLLHERKLLAEINLHLRSLRGTGRAWGVRRARRTRRCDLPPLSAELPPPPTTVRQSPCERSLELGDFGAQERKRLLGAGDSVRHRLGLVLPRGRGVGVVGVTGGVGVVGVTGGVGVGLGGGVGVGSGMGVGWGRG